MPQSKPSFKKEWLMQFSRRFFLTASSAAYFASTSQFALAAPLFELEGKPGVPQWAVMQRRLIDEMSDACLAFYHRYFDERGYFECYERWGANDGPDDAIENLNNWPQFHAIGAKEAVKTAYTQGWEGHLKQFTEAKTTELDIAKDGMFYKEFNVQFDWQHLAEETEQQQNTTRLT
jgi:hypothetical protein